MGDDEYKAKRRLDDEPGARNQDDAVRQRMEETLQASAEQWYTTFNAMSNAICLLDSQGRIQRCNRAMVELLNRSLGEILGQRCWELVHGAPAPIDECPVIRMQESLSRESLIVPLGDRWFDVSVDPFLADDGQCVWAVHVMTDITERVRSERERAQAEEKLRYQATLLKSISDAVITTDLDCTIQSWNSAAEALYGWRAEEAIGKQMGQVIPTEYPHDQYDTVLAHFRAEGVWQGEVIQKRKDGGAVFALASVTLVKDDVGEPISVLVVNRDITERRRVEEQMYRQERLAAVGQLAGGIAHDFNNFLTIIMLYTHMLQREENIPSGAVPLVGTIRDESRRAAQLVQQILDFSRRSAMETEPVDLVAFIEETLTVLRQTLPENVRLLTEMGKGEYTVNADPTRIQQVVMNLALNACDAMPEGGDLCIALSEIVVRPGEKLPVADMWPGEWVCLSVADTGTGMTEEVLSHVFEPFFTTKGPSGTGLGLSQVYGIVQQHGGRIGIDTELGQGTTFWVYLPAYCAEEGVERVSEEKAAILDGRGEVILFVEDGERVREAGQRVLESLGYRVLTASNGREALSLYRAAEETHLGQGQEIDLVLTDMVMPEMGGKDLIRELRRINAGVKILAITGHTMREDMLELREQGLVEVVYKPLDGSRLGEAVRRALDAE
jgi:two-component system cell cycle sensor histidine kinase/response regulator CckA